MAMNRRRNRAPALHLCVLPLIVYCLGAVRDGSSGELDRCALLTDAEITDAIGPHDTGSSSLSNEWGMQSCRWTATKAQNIEGLPEWHDAIEVAAFDAGVVPMIRQQIRGDPLAGFVPGATYDHLYGELWFDCPQGRLCVVKVRTASGDRRQQIATKLARLVESRLR